MEEDEMEDFMEAAVDLKLMVSGHILFRCKFYL